MLESGFAATLALVALASLVVVSGRVSRRQKKHLHFEGMARGLASCILLLPPS
jgi:hypothetical protein